MCSYCGQRCRGRYDKQVCRVRDLSLAGWRIYLEYERWRVNCSGCGGVHVEHLEAFGQLWDYRTERGARAFFTRWKDSLKWQRLHPYQKFAGMIESHWDGIASLLSSGEQSQSRPS